jgi:cbb3-type cytochrome oxidase subunit 3
MFKHILASSANEINWMAILALLTFVTIFLVGVVQIFFQKKAFIDHMANLPLDDSHEDQ